IKRRYQTNATRKKDRYAKLSQYSTSSWTSVRFQRAGDACVSGIAASFDRPVPRPESPRRERTPGRRQASARSTGQMLVTTGIVKGPLVVEGLSLVEPNHPLLVNERIHHDLSLVPAIRSSSS